MKLIKGCYKDSRNVFNATESNCEKKVERCLSAGYNVKCVCFESFSAPIIEVSTKAKRWLY